MAAPSPSRSSEFVRQWVSPTLSKPDIGKGLHQTVHIIRTRASGYPSWPGVSDSTQGRIHWRRPSAIVRFSIATLRRTIHTEKTVSRELVPVILGKAVKSVASPYSRGSGASKVQLPDEPWRSVARKLHRRRMTPPGSAQAHSQSP